MTVSPEMAFFFFSCPFFPKGSRHILRRDGASEKKKKEKRKRGAFILSCQEVDVPDASLMASSGLPHFKQREESAAGDRRDYIDRRVKV